MVFLKELGADNFQLVAEWLSNPDINRWLSSEWRHKGSDATATMVAIAVRNRRNRMFLILQDNEPCGVAALSEFDSEDGTANLWYAVGNQSLWGRGITTSAVRELTRFAFEKLGLSSISAWAMETNVGSQKVLQKAGFREIGIMRNSAWNGERRVARIYYDLIPSDLGM